MCGPRPAVWTPAASYDAGKHFPEVRASQLGYRHGDVTLEIQILQYDDVEGSVEEAVG
jgi:hypothetical protein